LTTQTNRREFLKVASAGLAASAFAAPLLAACGSSSPSPSGAASSGSPKRGGLLRFASGGGQASDTPDPALAFTSFALYMAANLYDTLIRADVDFNLSPALATEWSSTPDAKTWTFKIRSGVKFHGGKKLTSADVAYSVKRILSAKLASPALSNISPFLKPDGIATPDAKTVQFKLYNANAFFPQILASVNFGIVPDGTTSFAKPVGTGPFSLKEFQALANAKLVRNDDYWRSGLPYLDGITLVSLAEDSTRVQSLIGGSEDLVDTITGGDIKVLSAQPGVQILQIKAGGWVDLAAWGNTKPFNNPDVVKAMKLAADRAKIMGVVAPNSFTTGADIPVPTTDPFFPAGLAAYPYDPAQAKSLITKAGYRDGLDLTLYAYEGDKLDAALAYKQTAQPAGINVHVITSPHATYFTDIWLKKPFVGDSWARLHTSVILQEAFAAVPNEFHWSSSKFSGLLASAVSTTDLARQKTLYGDALTMLNDSVSGIIPGWEPQLFGASSKLHGVQITNGLQVFLDSAYFA